jgi:hypothetical protein
VYQRADLKMDPADRTKDYLSVGDSVKGFLAVI